MWMMVFQVLVAAVYGYVIVLSLWAMRVQRRAAKAPHHPYGHPAMSHDVERVAHKYVARILIASLAVRLAQLNLDMTSWLLVPLTILAALLTTPVLAAVSRMAIDDLGTWYIGLINKLKTIVLLLCTAGLFADQVWRVVTLFWF